MHGSATCAVAGENPRAKERKVGRVSLKTWKDVVERLTNELFNLNSNVSLEPWVINVGGGEITLNIPPLEIKNFNANVGLFPQAFDDSVNLIYEHLI